MNFKSDQILIEKSSSSSCTMALGSVQPLTEMSTRNLHGGLKGGLPGRKADNLTAVCEPIA
jgi:hypothetical protein